MGPKLSMRRFKKAMETKYTIPCSTHKDNLMNSKDISAASSGHMIMMH
jgi:hypothetical protein